MRYLLDTGLWLRLSREPQTLPEACRTLLSPEPRVALSAVSLREVAWKAAQGKLDLGRPTLAWFKAALTSQLVLLPLTPEIAADSAALPVFPVDDPYDQMIVATSRQHSLTLNLGGSQQLASAVSWLDKLPREWTARLQDRALLRKKFP